MPRARHAPGLKHQGGHTESSWGSHDGLPGGNEGVTGLEEVGNGAPEAICGGPAIWNAFSSLP